MPVLSDLQAVCHGILIGSGRQLLATVVTLSFSYFLALPVGIPLMFCTSLGVIGTSTQFISTPSRNWLLALYFRLLGWPHSQPSVPSKCVYFPVVQKGLGRTSHCGGF